MQVSHRKSSVRVVLSASVMVLGALSAVTASAADGAKSGNDSASCREETRRVAVWQQGGNPKFNQSPRYEERLVKVCDGKVVSEVPQRSAAK